MFILPERYVCSILGQQVFTSGSCQEGTEWGVVSPTPSSMAGDVSQGRQPLILQGQHNSGSSCCAKLVSDPDLLWMGSALEQSTSWLRNS